MVTSSYPLFAGDGTAPFIEEIARAVAARGHEVDIVLPYHPRLKRDPENRLRLFPFRYAPHPTLNVWGYAQSLNADRGFKWKTLAVAPFAALATRRAVHARLAAERYAAVHAHWVVPGGVLARAAAERARLPFVISLHGSDVFAAERGRALGILARRAFEAAALVTACSSDLRDRALRLGAPEPRTRVLPYGVDAEFFGAPSAGEATASMRRRLGASAGKTLVVAVGRLVEKKGFEYLIRAAADQPQLHVAVVGDGDLGSHLKESASTANASMTFAGRFSREEIRDALRSADVVAVPSVVDSKGNVDGLPNVLLEAMAAGKAIVASRVAGIPDVMDHEIEGLLVPPGDATALRAALARLSSDAGLSARLGAAAAAKVKRDLTWSRVAATLENGYAHTQALAER